MEEAELVAMARSGDSLAYRRLIEKHQGIAFRNAFLITRDTSEAEDVTQEAFVKAYRSLARFRPEAQFRPWLLRIVTNESRNRVVANQRRGLREDAASQTSVPRSEDPGQLILASEGHRCLLDAVDRLPQRDRLIVSLRYFLDLNEVEIAEVLRRPKAL